MSTNSTSSIFSGTSRYSTDFRQIIDRAVAIASLPKAQMESAKSALSAQSAALKSLASRFEAIQGALAALNSSAAAYSVYSSDGTVASPGVAAGALPGVYQIQVVNLGAHASSMSKDGLPRVADPASENLSSASSFTLTVAGAGHRIEPAGASLTRLAEAINASGAPVEATIVNIGPSSAPDYRLSLRSATLGGVSLQLNDGSADLLEVVAAGAPAEYRVNGQPAAAIASDSRSVTVAPGLTLTMLKEGSASITVSRNAASVANALSSLASAYNAAVDEMDKHRGKDGGALRGSSMLNTLARSMREMAAYEPGSGSLASLGVQFSDQGRLSLDMAVFTEATAGRFEALATFLGSSTTQGFLKHAADLMGGLNSPDGGVIETAVTSLRDQIAWQDTRIAEEQARIDKLEESLVARMTAADALIASLELKVRYMTGLFEAMQGLRSNRR